MGAGGGALKDAPLQIGEGDAVPARVGEGGGGAGGVGLHRAQGEPALHRVQVELVPVDHQGQGSQGQSGGDQQSQQPDQNIRFLGGGCLLCCLILHVTSLPRGGRGRQAPLHNVLVIPQPGHIQPAGWDGGAGEGAVARVQDGGDVLRGQLALGGIDHSAHHGPDHVVEEAVGAHPALDQLPLPLHLEVVDGAYGGTGLGAHGAHRPKVVGAHELAGGPLHHRLVQMLGVEPGPVHIESVAQAGVINAVGVFLFPAGADGVEFHGHLDGPDHHDVVGQAGVDRQGQAVAGDGGGGAEVGHIDLGVDAGVGAPGAGAFDRVKQD